MSANQNFVFCVDLDGVVGDYEEALRRHVARQRGVDPSEIGEQTSWDFTGWPIRDRDDFIALHTGAVAEGMFADMPVIEGASDELWRLSDAGAWVRIVTHRLVTNFDHARVVTDTVSWLQHPRISDGRPRIPYRDICFLGTKQEVGGDLYVDDGPHNIKALRDAGLEAVVFDHAYNRDLPGPRVTNWAELADLVLAKMEWSVRNPTSTQAA